MFQASEHFVNYGNGFHPDLGDGYGRGLRGYGSHIAYIHRHIREYGNGMHIYHIRGWTNV